MGDEGSDSCPHHLVCVCVLCVWTASDACICIRLSNLRVVQRPYTGEVVNMVISTAPMPDADMQIKTGNVTWLSFGFLGTCYFTVHPGNKITMTGIQMSQNSHPKSVCTLRGCVMSLLCCCHTDTV